MKRRKWDTHTKVMIVIKGLKGKPVPELCHEHQISQSLYDQWRTNFWRRQAKLLKTRSVPRKRRACSRRTSGSSSSSASSPWS
jgi:transposase-like protein